MEKADPEDLREVLEDVERFLRNHPQLELCDHNSNAFLVELSELCHPPTLADLERAYEKLAPAGKLILIGAW